MLFLFLKERLAWICFLFLLILFTNILFYFDAGFSSISIGYYNVTIILFSLLFFIWRYFRETRQLKKLLDAITEESFDIVENMSLSTFQKEYIKRMKLILENKDYQLNFSNIKLKEDREDLLAWVHEMKTPLTAMRLMTEQIGNQQLQNKIEKEWLRLHLLLDQQLHNTRLDNIEKDNRLEKVSLKTVIYEEIKEYQSWCIEKGIGFQIENVDMDVVTDKKWLGFIIRQLLSNAIKYSEENSEIHIQSNQDEQGHLLLHIEDFGMGISKVDLPRIFEKSFTGTTGRNKSHSTGMGLYLAKNAANKLGIQLLVDSQLGNGSTFTLLFPMENEYEKVLGR